MVIDILFLAMMCFAVFKGMQNGLIVAIFSIVGWILGIYAAFRFSDIAAARLQDSIDVSPRVLSIISFILVFSLVIIIVNLGARLIERTIQLTPVGWLNRLGGIFFYVLLYALIFSVIVYFAGKVNLLSRETISSSRVWRWIEPLARFVGSYF
jgi:membrane protein required for colicin V production